MSASVTVAYLGGTPQPQAAISVSKIVDVREARTLSALDWRLADLRAAENDKVVFIKVRNADGRPLTFGTERIQIRAESNWRQTQQVAWLNGKWCVAEVGGRSQAEFVAAVLPHNTEAVRLFLEYRAVSRVEELHRTRYHNWYVSYPKLCRLILPTLGRWVIAPVTVAMSDSGWQSVTVEHPLPTRHNNSTSSLTSE